MHALKLAWRMLWRDVRAGELHLLGLALIIAVAALTSVGFLADRISTSLDREGNQLLGGDLLLSADHPWRAGVADEAHARGLATTATVLFTSMLGNAHGAELASVKAVQDGYPLRGVLRTAPALNEADTVASGVPAPGEVWLDERLMTALQAKVGDVVEFGQLDLRVAALLTFESDRGGNFISLAPRALVNVADLDASGLLGAGSRARYRIHVAGEAGAVTAFESWARAGLERGERVENLEEAQPAVRNALDQAQRYLRLAALVAVVLAAVAVGLCARRFMQRHLDACAVMRCLGASGTQIQWIVSAQFNLFGAVAALVGSLLGWALQASMATILASVVQTELPAPSIWPFVQGLAVGWVLVMGFVVPHLLQLGRVPTLRVLRHEVGGVSAASRHAWLAGALALAALVLWIAADLRLGLWIAGGFIALAAVFVLLAWGGLTLVSTLAQRLPLSAGWRYGLAALRRRRLGSILQAAALGVGLTALLLLALLRGDLLADWQRIAPADAPNRFILNIQPAQHDAVMSFFAAHDQPVPDILPMIRGRFTAINDVPVVPDSYENDRTQRLAEREFNLSHASAIPPGNEISAGQWHGDSHEPQWSVESGLAESFGLKLGDRLRFNVAGRMVEAPVTSLRTLDWDSMRVNFFVIASPGLLDDGAASLITSVRLEPAGAHAFTRELVRAFPNLTVIDVGAMLAQVQTMTDRLMQVVQFIFACALLAGVIVLYAALQATHDERAFEVAMLRTLGARHAQVRQALLVEFALLGLAAGLLAVVGAVALAALLAHFVFELTWLPNPWPLLVLLVLSVGGVMLGGWLGTRRLLERPPLASLRALA